MNRKGNGYFYTVSVLRRASGRGKSRKAGGLITFQLPNEDETFESSEVINYPCASICTHPWHTETIIWKASFSTFFDNPQSFSFGNLVQL